MTSQNITAFSAAVKTYLNLTDAVTPPSGTARTSSSKALATAIPQFDLSNADYGTFLLKDRINDEGYADSLVTLKQDALQTLYQHIANVKDITQQIETSDPADTIAHAALVEELATPLA